MKGIVFDIQKSALHDGPGIRTVIFLKGCPFRCVWCCNPESISPDPQLGFDESRCDQCLNCIDSCPTGALNEEQGKFIATVSLCNACRNCISECPQSALKIYGYETDSDTLLAEVMKDVDYYCNSGGGLTLSGGDAMFQFEFACEILTKAKELGLNTCLESEGFVNANKFLKIIPLVDYFYFDYKITNPVDHLRYTGVSNKLVLQNLELLNEHQAHITLRCVIVPDINNNDEHFGAIAALSEKYTSIKSVEVLAYHAYGSGKYRQIGKEMVKICSKSVTPEIASKWVNRIREFGGRNVRLG